MRSRQRHYAHAAAAVLGVMPPVLVVLAALRAPHASADALGTASLLAVLRSTLLAMVAAPAVAAVVGSAIAAASIRLGRAGRRIVFAAAFVALAVPLRAVAQGVRGTLGLDGLPGYALVMVTGFGLVAVPLMRRMQVGDGACGMVRSVGFGAALAAWRACAETAAAKELGVATIGAVARWRAAHPLSAAEAPALATLQVALCVALAVAAWRLRPRRPRPDRGTTERVLDAALLIGAGCPPAATTLALTTSNEQAGAMLVVSAVPWLLATAALLHREMYVATAAPSPPR